MNLYVVEKWEGGKHWSFCGLASCRTDKREVKELVARLKKQYPKKRFRIVAYFPEWMCK